jgi:hypothetical protein
MPLATKLDWLQRGQSVYSAWLLVKPYILAGISALGLGGWTARVTHWPIPVLVIVAVVAFGGVLLVMNQISARTQSRTGSASSADLGIDFFENQHELNLANGSLSVELERAGEIDAVWPAGGSAQNLSIHALKNIRRLIVMSADVPEVDLKAYADRYGAFDLDEVKSAIRTLTKKAMHQGTQVRWHPNPAMSAVINKTPGKEWVRIEIL